MSAVSRSPEQRGEVRERRRLRVTGTVQGVGFRPFVYRHAVALGLRGFVRNDSSGVLIEVEGTRSSVSELRRLLDDAPPPLARIATVETTLLSCTNPGEPGDEGEAGGFVIAHSEEQGPADVPVSVDTGPCAACLAEVDDALDRRHRYPFTNCTDCGPRYTIVLAVPYDRPATTMAGFAMCAECQREYADPNDRRFHAQPNACPTCGPQVTMRDAAGKPAPEVNDPLAAAGRALLDGAILAVKGVGGYHLAVDATNPAAVNELRRRKARDDKPFAVMVPDRETARSLVELGADAMALLESPRRPIVLAPRRPGGPVVAGVAPGLAELGVMLPYSPLHKLLLDAAGRPLVMTSGNLSDEPIAYNDDDAIERLGPLVDAIVTHNRPIHIRCDDSVVRARPPVEADGIDPRHDVGAVGAAPAGESMQMLRRSRGYSPEPLVLPIAARHPLLAVGAQLKNTVAVAKGTLVIASHHLGDLEHLATYQSFLQAIDHIGQLYGVQAELVVHDLHPEYVSTKLAKELDLPTIEVQHHHAHIASCLVDNGRSGPVIGVAFDGLGYGLDGTMWGGELLIADLTSFERLGHLAAVPMPGGSAAIREPWRMAVSWLHQSCGTRVAEEVGSRIDRRAADVVALLGTPAAVMTSSVGRLFDAVATLAGGRSAVTYEGQAAVEIEAWCAEVPLGTVAPYPIAIDDGDGDGDGDGLVLNPRSLVEAVVADVAEHRPRPEIAAAFHEGVAAATVLAVERLSAAVGLRTVALSGGVFQNVRLSGLVEAGLHKRGLEVLVHRSVPPNDGGISIGQAVVAAARSAG